MGGVYQDIVLPVKLFYKKEEISEKRTRKTFQTIHGYTKKKNEAHILALAKCIRVFSEYTAGGSATVLENNSGKKHKSIFSKNWGNIIHVVSINYNYRLKNDAKIEPEKRYERKYIKKLNIIISPDLEENKLSTVNLEITNLRDGRNKTGLLSYDNNHTFTYSDMERYANQVGIVVVSSKESYHKKLGYECIKDCEARRDGVPFAIYQDGLLIPIKYSSEENK